MPACLLPHPDVARFAECMLRGGSPPFRREYGEAVHPLGKRRRLDTRTLGWDTPSQPGLLRADCSPGWLSDISALPGLAVDRSGGEVVGDAADESHVAGSRAAIDSGGPPRVHDAIVEALEIGSEA